MTARSRLLLVVRWLAASLVFLVFSAAVPTALTANWLKKDILNTPSFVELYAPLAHSPQLHAFIATETSKAVTDYVDEALPTGMLEQTTSGIAGLLDQLQLPSDWSNWVSDLPTDLNAQVAETTETVVLEFLNSSAFPPIWTAALKNVHSQLIGTLDGSVPLTDPISDSTVLSLQTGPLLESLKESLLQEGMWWAEFIPVVDTSFPVMEITEVSVLQESYKVLNMSPELLLGATILLLVIGLLIAPARFFGLALAGILTATSSILAWNVLHSAWERHFQSVAGEDAAALSQHLWDVSTASLAPTISLAVWISLGVALLSLILGLILHLVSNRRARQRYEASLMTGGAQ